MVKYNFCELLWESALRHYNNNSSALLTGRIIWNSICNLAKNKYPKKSDEAGQEKHKSFLKGAASWDIHQAVVSHSDSI